MEIKTVAVLGTGVMGGQIAAHLTNAGLKVYAFDINQEVAEKGIDISTKIKPSAYYNPKTVEMITPLNYNDHLKQISECDWIIEVIAERIDWKHDLYTKIQPHLKKDAIITSNTSGISAAELISKMDEKMDERTDTENCDFVVKEFSNRGIPVDEIKPKENVFTFGKWIKRGRSVRKGETGVKICWLTERGGLLIIYPLRYRRFAQTNQNVTAMVRGN